MYDTQNEFKYQSLDTKWGIGQTFIIFHSKNMDVNLRDHIFAMRRDENSIENWMKTNRI